MARLVWWKARRRSISPYAGRRGRGAMRRGPGPVRWIFAVAVAALSAFAVSWGWGEIDRALHAVKPGVTLDGEPMGRLLPDELGQRLRHLAARWRVEPVDARYDPESGAVVPEVTGRRLDAAATGRALLEAERGGEVEPIWLYEWPNVRASFFEPLFHGPTDTPHVALAVNIDWGEEVLPRMLETLEAVGARVTFFPTGRWAERFPEWTARLAEAGHEVATHGMRHDNPVRLDRSAFERHVRQGAEVVERITGQMPRLYAPPAGEWDDVHVRYAAEMGYRTVLWTVDTVDWMGPSADEIAARVLARASGGSIVLMHPKPATVEALPRMISGLRERGYEIVPVSRLADLS